MQKETVIKCTEKELLQIINDYFSTDLDSIVAMEELSNGFSIIEVKAKPFSESDQEAVDQFKETSFAPFILNTLLNHLCWEKVIEAGTYQIDHTW